MMSDLSILCGKMLHLVSLPLFGFILIIKLRNFNFKSHWHTSKVFWSKTSTSDLNMSCHWICPAKQYLIWFKLHCLNRILAISWEIQILNVTEIVYFSIKDFVDRSKFVPVFLAYYYYKDDFELQKCLMILKSTEMCFENIAFEGLSGFCPRTNKSEMIFLVIDGTTHWPSISNLF